MKRNDLGSQDVDFDLAAEVAVSEGEPTESGTSDLGHLVIVLLASTLAGLRDRLSSDGFEKASDLVSDLTDRCDEFLTEKVG
jgi:hypothetical protein